MHVETKQRLDRLLGWPLLLALRPPAQALGFIMHRRHSLEPAGELVFIKMLGGGSLLLSLPALLGLRRRYPSLPLTMVCGSQVAPFAELVGVFDHIECIQDQRGMGSLLATGMHALGSLLRRQVDTIVDFEVYSVLSSVFSLMTCARNRIGFYLENTYWRRNLHTHLVFFNRSSGAHHFYNTAVRMLDAEPASMAECREHLAARVLDRSHSAGESWLPALPPGTPFVAVGAGCSDFGSVRALPIKEWCSFAASRRGELERLHWVFFGGAADHAVSESIAQGITDVFAPDGFHYTNLCGDLPLRSSLALLSRASLFIGIDSALLHAARFFLVPSISFWGPTHPTTRLQPIEGYREEIHYRPPICSPCLHVAEMPPCKGNNVCMRLFTEEGVPSGQWYEDSSGSVFRPGDSPS
jgi:ADP-heptose:LPS heptosyltransferase